MSSIMDENNSMRTNSKNYIAKHFPQLINFKTTTSKMWEHRDRPDYLDNWWFKFMESDLRENEHIVFAGALDKLNKDFKILKVPSSYLTQNLPRLDMTDGGWVNIYVHMRDLKDVRKPAGVPFVQFAVN
jgi:hypothetical protein